MKSELRETNFVEKRTTNATLGNVANKQWRFCKEMEEIKLPHG